jgi:hypothetical protein
MERRKVLRLFLVSSVAAFVAPKLTFGRIPLEEKLDFSSLDFGSDFKWGVATAAYQIEGAHNIEGKSSYELKGNMGQKIILQIILKF